MKKLLILTIVAMTAIPAHADNMITRFWDKSQPYAEIDIVKPLSVNTDKLYGNIQTTSNSSSGFEVGLGISYQEYLEIGIHHTQIIGNTGFNYELNMIKSKLRLANDYKLKPFIGIGIGMGQFITVKDEPIVFSYEVSLGFDAKLTDSVNIRPQLYYDVSNLKGTHYSTFGTYAENLNELGIKIGIQFNF